MMSILYGFYDGCKIGSIVETVTIELKIKAPAEIILKAFSDYDHAPVLHKKYVKSVKVLEQHGNVSVAQWRLKILCFWSTVKQRQTILEPDRLRNETMGGFAAGTIENTCLKSGPGGTDITDTIEVRVPKWGGFVEKLIAAYTRRMATGILLDHKRDLESRGTP